MEEILKLWAKTGSSQGQGRANFHPLIYHVLDVAAVAEALLAQSHMLDHMAQALGAPRAALARMLIFCVALHDIGKCSIYFQMQAPEIWPGANFGPFPKEALARRAHGEITDLYLRAKWDDEADAEEPALLTALFRQVCGAMGQAEGRIISAIAGHHGAPTGPQAPMTGQAYVLNKPFALAAKAVVAELAEILGGDKPALSSPPDKSAAATLSWLLSALTPVSDWIGSNQEWFAPAPPVHQPRAYWEKVARPRAQEACAASGINLAPFCAPSQQRTLGHLGSVALTPLQAYSFACPLGSGGAALFLVEDATGAGKTEAAMALTHRLMAAGRAQGFYFALPTMATANAMYERLRGAYQAMFADGARPSLSLAHGKAKRNQDFLASLQDIRSSNGAREPAAGAYCSGWIADSRRKALLAQGGAGTIDQALMAVLPLRYQSLRVFGLTGKVLILDEIHAFDPFMLRLIEALIELHAMLGGSVILMSATLPISTRQRLVEAFNRGAGGATSARVGVNAYPLLTSVTDGKLAETALPLASTSARRVRVERIGSVDEAEALALRMARQGAAVALIRSTVDAAIESFERIGSRHDATELFHARFLLDDRLAIERRVLARFGKGKGEGAGEARRGRILVATQVIEQSLDLDFDVLITDLAPIDLIIQRAGRLWRHAREGRPVASPVLYVTSPEPRESDKPNWLEADLPQAAWVYGDVARLWLSAKRLFDAGAIETSTLGDGESGPAHVRRLVEAVYGADAEHLPNEDLAKALDRFFGEKIADRLAAQYIVLEPRQGYAPTASWESEARASTRLELKPRVTVRLARAEAGVLRPLGADWSLSELRLTQHAASGLEPPTQAEAGMLRPAWVEADLGVRLLVLQPDGPDALASADRRYRYDPVYGLRIGTDEEKVDRNGNVGH
jgi:CRISPR-associated endonuclease/helicase Cas3